MRKGTALDSDNYTRLEALNMAGDFLSQAGQAIEAGNIELAAIANALSVNAMSLADRIGQQPKIIAFGGEQIQ